MVFTIGKAFALHAGKEHRALRLPPFSSQLQFMHDTDGEVFIRYTEDVGLKTNKGGIKHRKGDPKHVDLYVSDNPECCPIGIIMKYLAMSMRTCQVLYLQPRKNFFGRSWYLNCPASVNRLRNVVKNIGEKAKLPGFYSNHSLCSTPATKFYHNNVDEQLIHEITGHRSLATCSYKRTSDQQRKFASKCIFSS